MNPENIPSLHFLHQHKEYSLQLSLKLLKSIFSPLLIQSFLYPAFNYLLEAQCMNFMYQGGRGSAQPASSPIQNPSGIVRLYTTRIFLCCFFIASITIAILLYLYAYLIIRFLSQATLSFIYIRYLL